MCVTSRYEEVHVPLGSV